MNLRKLETSILIQNSKSLSSTIYTVSKANLDFNLTNVSRNSSSGYLWQCIAISEQLAAITHQDINLCPNENNCHSRVYYQNVYKHVNQQMLTTDYFFKNHKVSIHHTLYSTTMASQPNVL